MAEPGKNDAPLVRPALVRFFAGLAVAAMAVALVVDFVHGHEGHFGFDGITGFDAVFGLVAGFVIIGVAKGLGIFLGRPDSYYGDGQEPDE